jgi:Tol biopolymer transport system component
MGGGNGQIAFASDSSGVVQIYLQDIDGGIPQRITDMPEGACQPNFSPDGQRLVFISPCDSEHESYPGAALFLINVDGSGLMPLPSAPGGDYDPAWSPDGKKIAFTSIRNGGRPRIYLFNLEDNSVKRLSDQYVRDLQPSWSADGRHIVFASTRRGPTQIWFMDANGQNQMLFSASVDRIDQYPNLSPDGKVVLFTQQVVKGGVPKLFVAPVEEGEDYTEFRVSQDQSPMREARYSPDGLWIVFEGWPQGSNHDIYIMTANGVGRKALTTGPSIEFDPTWRPFSP